MESSSHIRLDLETERLHLRPWTAGDTSWHRYLAGERGRGTRTGAHGHGYATEAAVEVVAAARQTGRSRLWSTVRSWNAPSFRVLEKLGFTRHHSVWDDDGEVVWNMLDLH